MKQSWIKKPGEDLWMASRTPGDITYTLTIQRPIKTADSFYWALSHGEQVLSTAVAPSLGQADSDVTEALEQIYLSEAE